MQMMRKCIFPGTCLPYLGDITEVGQVDLTVGHTENWKLHYAETARDWRMNFHANREQVARLDEDYDERFLCMWDYYLQILEGGFRYGTLQLYQILFCHGKRWTLPIHFKFHDETSTSRLKFSEVNYTDANQNNLKSTTSKTRSLL